ncbi:MAG: hypothetical protein R2751_17850 [Bacteroidales bacterium]
MAANFEPVALSTKEDFKLDGPVKWCAGCGGHAVLSTIMNVLPKRACPRKGGVCLRDQVFVVPC